MTTFCVNSFADGGGFTGTHLPYKKESSENVKSKTPVLVNSFNGGATGT